MSGFVRQGRKQLKQIERSNGMNIEIEKEIVNALPSLYPLQDYEEEAIYTIIKAIPHWIPVTEKLPETDDEVLTTYIVNGNRGKRYVETSRYYYDGFSGYWSSPWDEYRIAGVRIEVIAWMPLPDPWIG